MVIVAAATFGQDHGESPWSLPVHITETGQCDEWLDKNNGWAKKAYSEINDWNKNGDHQKIRALILYRWHEDDRLSFKEKKCDRRP